MIITLYYVRFWTEGVWSKKRKGTNSYSVRHFRTHEACQEYIYQQLPRYTQKDRLEPTWINWEIITKKQYIPTTKTTE